MMRVRVLDSTALRFWMSRSSLRVLLRRRVVHFRFWEVMLEEYEKT